MPLYYGNAVFANVGVSNNALGLATPANHHLHAWTADPATINNAQIFANGQPRLVRVNMEHPAAATKIYWWVTTAGVTATAGQNHVGIYDSTGAKLASVNVDADITSTGLKTSTIASVDLQAGQFYWLAALFNAATAPTLAWGPSTALAAGGNAANVGLAVSEMRGGVNGSAQTSLPASITPGSNAISGVPWMAVGP